MKFLLLAFTAIFLFSFSSNAQVSYGGFPTNWDDKHIPSDIPFVSTNVLDREALALEDAVVDQYKEAPYRFGVEIDVDFTTENSGRWIVDSTSERALWQLGIDCPQATSISLLFSTYRLPKGATLFIWNKDRTEFLGSFTHLNNCEANVLAIGLLKSDRIVIEYSVPLLSEDWGQLELGQIVHGYRDIFASHFEDASADRGPYGTSGNCNVNINCPEGAEWQVEKRAVALIVSGGSALCTGALVNNTAQDGTPYFLTANHCLGGGVAGWVFYFNHESATCSGSTGPTTQSVSGATLKASSAVSDFGLLLLNSTPPADYNVEYAGWDNSDLESNNTAAIGIHHPSGDVKKISFENDSPYQSIGNGAQVWWIDNWEMGITEPGSSGSPLFNQNHQIIGQLFGGASACNGSVGNGQYDFYGRFGISWNTGLTASSRLKEWLDPINSGVTSLNGYPDGFVAAAVDAGVSAISGISSTVCGSEAYPTFTLRNYGTETLVSCTIHYQLNAGTEQTMPWTGSLAQNQQVQINLPTQSLANGSNTLTVWVTNPNGIADENSANNQSQYAFTAFTGTLFQFSLSLTLDDYPGETSWDIADGNNTILFSSNGSYSSSTGGTTVSDSFCLLEGCYNFTIYDDFGDGICCVYGNGSYTIYNQNNVAIASGGTFADSETTQICVNANSVNQLSNEHALSVFPNPANDFVRIQGLESGSLIQMYDATGRLVNTLREVSNVATVPLTSCENGWYTLRITSLGKVTTQPIIVRH